MAGEVAGNAAHHPCKAQGKDQDSGKAVRDAAMESEITGSSVQCAEAIDVGQIGRDGRGPDGMRRQALETGLRHSDPNKRMRGIKHRRPLSAFGTLGPRRSSVEPTRQLLYNTRNLLRSVDNR